MRANDSISGYHKLRYAGVELSSLTVASTAFVESKTERHHSQKDCYNRTWRSEMRERTVAPHSVPASKGCGHCFSGLVTDPRWPAFRALADAISADDASFLRTALAKKSKKNTPEEAARIARRLSTISTNVETVRRAIPGSDTLVADSADALVERLSERTALMRSAFASDSVREGVIREAAAVAALSTRRSDLIAKKLAKTAAHRSYDHLQVIGKMGETWANAHGRQAVNDALVSEIVTTLVKAASFGGLGQIEFAVTSTPRPGVDHRTFMLEGWSQQVRLLSKELVRTWTSEVATIDVEKEVSLVVFQQPSQYYGEQAKRDERLLNSLVELFAVHRVGERATLLIPTALVGAISGISINHYTKIKIEAADATDLDSVTANTAAALYDPASSAFASLGAAIEAARALMSED